MRWIPAVALVAFAACGSHSGVADAVDAFPTAPHTAYPQVPDQGGPRLSHPQLITVTFANDARTATLESFAQWIVGSQWLATVATEYGIGPGGVAGVAHRPETPATAVASADIEAYIASGITDGSIPTPAPPFTLADALYIIYYPATTTITATFINGIIKVSCTDFGGYHGEVHQGGMNFAYAAIPDCAGTIPGLSANETTEVIVSHEILEAATDAFPITAPAWQLLPDPTDAWFTAFQFEVELGDMCEEPSRYVREAGFVAQRAWSNAAALAGAEPCVPIDPKLPAFGATALPAGTQHIAPGASLDVALTGWATGTVADWNLSLEITGNASLAAQRTKVTLSTATINNAGMSTVHVDVPAAAPVGSTLAVYIISSHTADDATMWPLAIEIP